MRPSMNLLSPHWKHRNIKRKAVTTVARFIRTKPAPIVKGGYGSFLPYVRKDFDQCCAYCYFHERHAGGEENFEIDHFCPQWKCLDRINDFYNLYYSCHACNSTRKKWKWWPSDEQTANNIGFVDFCVDDFNAHYQVLPDGALKPLSKSAEYTIDRIRLNSDHLKKMRALLLKEGKAFDKEPS